MMSNQFPAYVVERVLNNNVLILQAMGQDEQIVIGRGIGFGAKRGMPMELQDVRIEKRFSLVHRENQEHFQQLFSVVPAQVIGVAEEIILMATDTLKTSLHEHIHVALADHIGFSLTRLQGGLKIDNPFLEEIQTLYPRAWAVAEMGATLIEERFGIPIPDEEVGFLALHIHSAEHAQGVSQTVRITNAVTLAVKALEGLIGQSVDRHQLNYSRMVIHLRFAIQRVMRDEPIRNPLAQTIEEKMPDSYRVAEAISGVVENTLKVKFPKDEIAYLTLHVERFRGQ